MEGDRVRGVTVAGHRIQTSAVANCAGLWGRQIGHMAGADVPLQAVEHYYAVSVKDNAIPRDLPVLRDQSAGAYIKEDAGSILVGAFEKEARPIDPAELPRDFSFGELEGDMEGQFLPIYEAAIRRIPILGRLGIRKFFCGPESFTPDGRVQIGPDDRVRGLWSCCGCNSQGIQSSAGYGSALADWIADGQAPCDLSALDVRRNEPFANSRAYVWGSLRGNARPSLRPSLSLPPALHGSRGATEPAARTSPCPRRVLRGSVRARAGQLVCAARC